MQHQNQDNAGVDYIMNYTLVKLDNLVISYLNLRNRSWNNTSKWFPAYAHMLLHPGSVCKPSQILSHCQATAGKHCLCRLIQQLWCRCKVTMNTKHRWLPWFIAHVECADRANYYPHPPPLHPSPFVKTRLSWVHAIKRQDMNNNWSHLRGGFKAGHWQVGV